ncbi:MAG: OmpH family outer membrane protein [Candidatus Omnitrophica bacterium]|nr:OmpH family outer membrane protein [Candidatus Omnitrophota bacterium]MDD5592955.1 OmpH family outer membrane protein [Candidatus Omnitrophota bacterium]
MRKFMFASLGLLLCVAFIGTTCVLAAEKIACVDLGRIFSEYSKTKDFDKTLGDKQAGYDTERNKKVNDIKQFQDKFNLLSDKEKEAKKAELETKIKSLQEFDRESQTDLRKQFNDKKTELIKDIDDTINRYAAKEGYTLVLSEAGLAYNAKNLDITDKILEALNKGYKK